MKDTLDRDEVAAALGELRRLVHRLDEVRAGFAAVVAAKDMGEAREQAFGLSANVPEARVFGVLDRVTPEELSGLLSAASTEARVQREVDELLTSMRQSPKLHRAMAHVHPYSFTPVGGEWWEKYRAELRALRAQPIWGMPEPHKVPLESIYVPSRYQREVFASARSKRQEREAAPVESNPLPLLRKATSEPPGAEPSLVFVVGGPGSGKSTLATMLASELAEDPLLQPLLIRLRDVSPERDLFKEIERVLPQVTREEEVGTGLREVFARAPRLVLLLDGFDELIQASRTGLGSFFLRVQTLLRDQRVQGVACFGRDTVFSRDDTALPEGATVVKLLPFDHGQVVQWCEQWHRATGKVFNSARLQSHGDALDAEVLRSLIHEPLTLRLLALLDLEGIEVLGEGRAVDLARIYHRVISETCKRHHAERGDFTAAELRRLLRVIGFAVMQSGQEVIRREDLQRALSALGLQIETDKTESKAIQLILAISQRRSEQDERAWEFLHKSLGEYLAAEFLAVEIAAMVAQERDEFGETTYRLSDGALCRRWIERFGVAVIPVGVERFLKKMAGDWHAFFEQGSTVSHDRDLGALVGRLGPIYGMILDEQEAEVTVRVARLWGLRPRDTLGISLGNVFLVAGLGTREYLGFAPERYCPGRYVDVYHALMRSPSRAHWDRILSRTLFVGIAEGSDLSRLDLRASSWRGVQAEKLKFCGALLVGSTFEGSSFVGCDFSSASMPYRIESVVFESCDFALSSWVETFVIDKMSCVGCRFVGSRFEGALVYYLPFETVDTGAGVMATQLGAPQYSFSIP